MCVPRRACKTELKRLVSRDERVVTIQRRVVCTAMRNKDGLIICGARHFDPIMRALVSKLGGPDVWRFAEQGFIDQWGTFLTRTEALQIAKAARQRRRRCGGDKTALYSENLY